MVTTKFSFQVCFLRFSQRAVYCRVRNVQYHITICDVKSNRCIVKNAIHVKIPFPFGELLYKLQLLLIFAIQTCFRVHSKNCYAFLPNIWDLNSETRILVLYTVNSGLVYCQLGDWYTVTLCLVWEHAILFYTHAHLCRQRCTLLWVVSISRVSKNNCRAKGVETLQPLYKQRRWGNGESDIIHICRVRRLQDIEAMIKMHG